MVSRMLSARIEVSSADGRKSRLPMREVPVGGEVRVSGRLFRCVRRPSVWPPCEACSGCDLSGLYLGCGDLRCSPFDRSDGCFVWFKEVK